MCESELHLERPRADRVVVRRPVEEPPARRLQVLRPGSRGHRRLAVLPEARVPAEGERGPARRSRGEIGPRGPRPETVIPTGPNCYRDGPPKAPGSANAERPIRGVRDWQAPWPRANPTRPPGATHGADPEGRTSPTTDPRCGPRLRDPRRPPPPRGAPRARSPEDSRIPHRLFLRHRPARRMARCGRFRHHEGGGDSSRTHRGLVSAEDLAPHGEHFAGGPTDGPRGLEVISFAARSASGPAGSAGGGCEARTPGPLRRQPPRRFPLSPSRSR